MKISTRLAVDFKSASVPAGYLHSELLQLLTSLPVPRFVWRDNVEAIHLAIQGRSRHSESLRRGLDTPAVFLQQSLQACPPRRRIRGRMGRRSAPRVR